MYEMCVLKLSKFEVFLKLCLGYLMRINIIPSLIKKKLLKLFLAKKISFGSSHDLQLPSYQKYLKVNIEVINCLCNVRQLQ